MCYGHGVKTPIEGQSSVVFFHVETFCCSFWALGIARACPLITVKWRSWEAENSKVEVMEAENRKFLTMEAGNSKT